MTIINFLYSISGDIYMKMRYWVIIIVIIISIILFFLYFGVQSPGSGCSSIGPHLFQKDLRTIYKESDAKDCGYYDFRMDNATEFLDCLRNSVENCEESKGFVLNGGIEIIYTTLYITKDCKVKIYRGGCGTSSMICNNVIHFDDVQSNKFKELCQ